MFDEQSVMPRKRTSLILFFMSYTFFKVVLIIFITISNPSLAPLKKISNTLFLSINPTLTINNIVNGIAKLEI